MRGLTMAQVIFVTFKWFDAPDDVRSMKTRVVAADAWSPAVRADLEALLRWGAKSGRFPMAKPADHHGGPQGAPPPGPAETPGMPADLGSLTDVELLLKTEELFGELLCDRQQTESAGIAVYSVDSSVGDAFGAAFNTMKGWAGKLLDAVRATATAIFRFVTSPAEKRIFGTFQNRAKLVGSTGVHDLLVRLQKAVKLPPTPPAHRRCGSTC
eukprot:TRINITY_DN17651_c0_g1_i1.p2 TRINITY_DN17651_c0_g1~~TRINITY_DN17651_c0_g1_i1.p2  ORF type:complete len:212 (-),score=64.08 TRINITY_DN17651_c0_g1_i1:27-662(-)